MCFVGLFGEPKQNRNRKNADFTTTATKSKVKCVNFFFGEFICILYGNIHEYQRKKLFNKIFSKSFEPYSFLFWLKQRKQHLLKWLKIFKMATKFQFVFILQNKSCD